MSRLHCSVLGLLSAIIVLILLGACRPGDGPAPAGSPSAAAAATPTFTPAPPTPTPVPLAASVNGEGIPLEQYQAELVRYQKALGTELATKDEQRVLDELIDRYLLVQAATEAGFEVGAQMVAERVEQLTARLGSAEALEQWLADNSYTQASFRLELAQSLAAAWMRDQIVSQVPQVAEQVHVRQVLLYNAERAGEVLNQLQSGADFVELAVQFDPVARGELGWFPRGYLLDEKLEEAAFKLQPGEISSVIQTEAGYHILLMIERDAQRPLDSDALQVLQNKALLDWLAERRSQAQIQVLAP
ncbi:MAG: peptidylprolyl isomerase [Anaerolineales bacterium]|nr:peptidylprolyl isomerase [Anaerolineales bacterium]